MAHYLRNVHSRNKSTDPKNNSKTVGKLLTRHYILKHTIRLFVDKCMGRVPNKTNNEINSDHKSLCCCRTDNMVSVETVRGSTRGFHNFTSFCMTYNSIVEKCCLRFWGESTRLQLVDSASSSSPKDCPKSIYRVLMHTKMERPGWRLLFQSDWLV